MNGTDVALVEQKIETLRQELALRWEAHVREHEMLAGALSRSDADLERRIHELNQMREQIASERGAYLTRDRYEAGNEQLRQRVQVLEQMNANYQGRFWMLALIPSVMVVVINVFLYLLRFKLP